MKFLISIALITLVTLGTLSAQQESSPAAMPTKAAEPWQVVTVNKVSLEGTLSGGSKFEVNVESSKPKTLEANYVGAAGQPAAAVSEITVKLGGEKISFPKQAFGDLANAKLQTVSVTSQPSGEVRLRFSGGEAPGTYEVEFFIQGNRLTKRSLSSFEAATGGKHEVVKTTTFD
jgi:hypothetical protein